MQLVSCQGGALRTLSVRRLPGGLGAADAPPDRSFVTGLAALDALPPGGAFARGAVHDLLSAPGHGRPRSFALLLARAASGRETVPAPVFAPAGREAVPVPFSPAGGVVVWSDPRGEIYPPAVAAFGLPLERVFLLRPKTEADEVWAVAECLGTRGVAAVVAAPPRLSRVQARRLQLAAERGGGVGLLLRQTAPRGVSRAAPYAAATRWLVAPAAGEPGVQRWRVELVHGHGGQVGKAVILEVCRDATGGAANHVCAVDAVADRPAPPERARASA